MLVPEVTHPTLCCDGAVTAKEVYMRKVPIFFVRAESVFSTENSGFDMLRKGSIMHPFPARPAIANVIE